MAVAGFATNLPIAWIVGFTVAWLILFWALLARQEAAKAATFRYVPPRTWLFRVALGATADVERSPIIAGAASLGGLLGIVALLGQAVLLAVCWLLVEVVIPLLQLSLTYPWALGAKVSAGSTSGRTIIWLFLAAMPGLLGLAVRILRA